MKTLFHATNEDYASSVLEFGIEAQSSDKPSLSERLDGSFVFGFDNIDDAISFGLDNFNHYAIFSFEVEESEAIVDTEYDGAAFAVERNIGSKELKLIGIDL